MKTGHGVSPHHSCHNGPGVRRTTGSPGDSASAALAKGVGQAGTPQCCLLSLVWPSSCGHCSICDVNSACPVVTALPSALDPDPLASRTLDTFCFERKQTLLKLLLGARAESLPPPLGAEFQGNLTGKALYGMTALPQPTEAARQAGPPGWAASNVGMEGNREPLKDGEGE